MPLHTNSNITMETGRKGKNGNAGTSSNCHCRQYLLQKIKKKQDLLGKALDDRESQVKERGTKYCVYWICQPISDNYWEYHLLKSKSSFFLKIILQWLMGQDIWRSCQPFTGFAYSFIPFQFLM